MKIKNWIIGTVVTLVLAVIVLAVMHPRDEVEPGDIAEYNGVQYINNEIIVIMEDGVTDEQVDELFSKYNADVDKSLAEQDLYLMVFPEVMSYEQINSLVEELEADPIVYGAGPDVIGDVDEMLGDE